MNKSRLSKRVNWNEENFEVDGIEINNIEDKKVLFHDFYDCDLGFRVKPVKEDPKYVSVIKKINPFDKTAYRDVDLVVDYPPQNWKNPSVVYKGKTIEGFWKFDSYLAKGTDFDEFSESEDGLRIEHNHRFIGTRFVSYPANGLLSNVDEILDEMVKRASKKS